VRRPVAAAGIAAWIAAALCPGVAATAPDTLDELMAMLAQRRHGVADFEQTQYLASLRQPVHSSGVMIYDAPAHLEEQTLKPRVQTTVLDGRQLTLQSGNRRRTLELADYPQIAPLLESIRATLAGDRAALEQRFELELSGPVDHWELKLRPRAAESAALVRSIRIAGERDAVLEVEVQLSDGDHGLMRIRPRS
jgi:hypothetical protein